MSHENADGAYGCAAPGRSAFGSHDGPAAAATASAGGTHTVRQAHVPAGAFTMGDSSGDRNDGDGEVPLHRVTIDAFDIDETAVTNAPVRSFEPNGYGLWQAVGNVSEWSADWFDPSMSNAGFRTVSLRADGA